MTTPLEERVATVVTKVEAAKTEAAKESVATPGGDQLVKKVEGAAVVTSAAVEPAKAVSTPAEQKLDTSKKDYINLAKMEARLQAERRQHQADVQAFQQRQQQLGTEERERYARELKSRAKTDPAGVAKEVDLDYGGWTSQILNNGESTADQKINALVEEIQNLRNEAQEEKDQSKRSAVERLNSEAIATVQNFRGEISQFVESNAEQYAGIKFLGLQSLVYDLIRGHYQAQGKLLSVREASDVLEEAVIGAVDKFVESKKWKDRISSKAKGTPAVIPATQKESKQDADREVRTVSNEMTAEAGTPNPETAKRLSFNERIQRTIASVEAKKAARI